MFRSVTTRILIVPALTLLLSVFAATARPDWEPGPAQYQVKIKINVKVPMRDGINLSADIYRPDAPGKFPCLLLRTDWGNNIGPLKVSWGLYFAHRGYGVALVDVPGGYDAEGVWEPFVDEPQDGYDTQQWLGQQDRRGF